MDGEKATLLAALAGSSSGGADLWREAPEALRADRECVAAALTAAIHAWPASYRTDWFSSRVRNILGGAAPALRADSELVRATVGDISYSAFVKTLTGKTVTVKYQLSDLVAELKLKIFDQEGWPPDQQKIVAGGEKPDWATAVGCGLPWEESVHVILRLRGDGEGGAAPASHRGYALVRASDAERADRGTVLAAVADQGWALALASVELRDDVEVVRAAVAQDGDALHFASEKLRGDPTVQRLAALKRLERALPHALLRLGLFGYLQHLPTMLDEGITVEMLPTLGHAELRELGMSTMGARKTFMDSVKLPEGSPPEPEPEPEPELQEPEPEAPPAAEGNRMASDQEVALTVLPTTKWTDSAPDRSCIDELRNNPDIRACVPDIDAIAEDVRMKVLELQYVDVPVELEECCVAAITAYTHDLQKLEKQGNVYFELNKMLRQRGAAQRAALLQTWGGFMYVPCALLSAQLPKVSKRVEAGTT